MPSALGISPIVSLLALVLHGCGGGGSEGGSHPTTTTTLPPTTTTTTTGPPPTCGSVFAGCSGVGDNDCRLPRAVKLSDFPKCDDALKKAFADFQVQVDKNDSRGMHEYILGGLSSGIKRKASCLTGLRYIHTSQNNACPMPLPPSLPDLASKHSTFNVLTIGDWGPTKAGPKEYCRCKKNGVDCSDSMFQYIAPSTCPAPHSKFWNHTEYAQQRVADMFAKKAHSLDSAPVAVLNVGDNFYYGGLASPANTCDDFTCMTTDYAFNHSWTDVYLHNQYDPTGRLRAPWLSVMGNHDYGGAGCLGDWQAQIDFTEMDPLKVWTMPFQYYKQRVQVDGYFIDIFMNEVNVDDCCIGDDHGICHQKLCSQVKGDEGACQTRMHSNKNANMAWLDDALNESNADGARWQIVVGHYVEMSNAEEVMGLMAKHGAQLYVGGHKHEQTYWPNGMSARAHNIPQIVTGAGGGIGNQGSSGYGYFNLEISHDSLEVQMYTDLGGEKKFTLQHPSLQVADPPVEQLVETIV